MKQALSPDALITRVFELIHARLAKDEAARVEPFARALLESIDAVDLPMLDAADVYGAVVGLWQFMSRRAPGQPRVRAFNPQPDETGWSVPHTVIEIVGDDMPFLVDSATGEINRQGHTLHLTLHPVLRVERNTDGDVLGLHPTSGERGELESVMHLHIDRVSDTQELKALTAGLERVLGDVRAAVSDWEAMRARMQDIIAGLPENAPIDLGEEREVEAFLQWMLDDHFVFLGCRDYRLVKNGDGHELHVEPGSGLGLLRDEDSEAVRSESFAALPQALRARAADPTLLTLTKTNTRSTVHRNAYPDYIGIKTFDENGTVIGERRVIGLFTSIAYNTSPQHIPLLRRKVSRVVERAGLLSGSHADKTLLTLLDRYPRDELFQIGEDLLLEHVRGMLRLGERQRVRLFLRSDPFGRFVSSLIFVPREHYNTEQRERIQAVLMDAFDGAFADFDVDFSAAPLARIQIVVHTRSGSIPAFDEAELEERVVEAARRWEDGLRAALVSELGETRGFSLFARYGNGFPAGYRERYRPDRAVQDIEQMDSLTAAGDFTMSLYRPADAADDRLGFKLYRLDTAVSLSHGLRMLERMGVTVTDERPSEIVRADGHRVRMHDFGLSFPDAASLDLDAVRELFHDTFRRVWQGEAENDEFNRLVLVAGLSWREIVMLRAYARYLKQAQFTFSQSYMEQALAAHPQITRELVALFHARFDPALQGDRAAASAECVQRIEAALENVVSLDEDRILRQFLALMQATLRTNFYCCGEEGEPRAWLSFKLDPPRIPELPEPRPMFEVYVYSPRIEGVHLRGGKVARGGVRWSDRLEDFRTEVLGLVKAQIVKNSVIVPAGSKGGFVVRKPPTEGGREALVAEGVACYQQYLSGMLDLTDNLVDSAVVPPANVVRHDEDDPYLVVAADKGTATFSDHANAVAAQYDFWLDDAFASGGSAGYDHKKMGITARGAWESVKRHFRHLGRDIQNEPFTVAGIGDMSGDVFGNGMLLSKHIRLVAAFDHRHIFIDPQPDEAATWEERARLFALPRSSWDDYDRALISQGGGVWSRTAKSIALTPEAREVLGIEEENLTPTELIRAILRAPVDLLYNGGIGTYVKAASESDADVGDRANDAVRVDGGELRCKVVGEGGNLGFTQLGRIEYAQTGGRNFTDAIDNAGGVDCSDHEVNIKILLGEAERSGALSREDRNVLLEDMTEEVAQLVLYGNYSQGQVLKMMLAARTDDEQIALMRRLVQVGRLNRELEFLPSDDELGARRAAGREQFVAPELAVLLSYAKIELYDEVLASSVPDDPWVASTLWQYFPAPLRERFDELIGRHALRREIIATQVVNNMVNRVGATFVDRIRAETGHSAPDIVRAYLASREVLGLESCWEGIEALDNRIPAECQIGMLLDLLKVVRSATHWFLRHTDDAAALETTIDRFAPGVARVAGELADLLPPAQQTALEAGVSELTGDGVPQEFAQRVATLRRLRPALDIVELAAQHECDANAAARLYFALSDVLDLPWLAKAIDCLPADTRWSSLARAAMRLELTAEARRLAGDAIAMSQGGASVDAFVAAQGDRLERYRALVNEAPEGNVDMAVLSVLLRALHGLGQG